MKNAPLLLPVLAAALLAAAQARAVPGAEQAAGAVPAGEKPEELQGAEIVDKLGAKVPLDVKLVDDSGAEVTLGKYVQAGDGKPVLLVLGYYQCPMLCSMVLNATLESLKNVSLEPGRDYRIVTVSIDPRDTTQIAAAKRDAYLKEWGREDAAAAWRFHTASEGEARRLADAVGFGYRWDEASKQYAHGAGIFFISPDGVLTRTIWGLTYAPADVKFALIDASQGKVGTVIDRILLSCFQYSTTEHKYSVYVMGIMRLGALVTSLAVGALLFVFWRREKARGGRAGAGT